MKTAVYVRVSTSRQAQAQTIDQQLDRLRAHLHACSEDLASETIFGDDGYSGATLVKRHPELVHPHSRHCWRNQVAPASPTS